jgi:hypothetical protein
MTWTLKLITESDSDGTKVYKVTSLERTDAFMKLATLAMSIEESKKIAASASRPRDTTNRSSNRYLAGRPYGCGVTGAVCGRAAESRIFSIQLTGTNPTSPERFSSSRVVSRVVEGGFFLRKSHLAALVSLYSDWKTAIAI